MKIKKETIITQVGKFKLFGMLEGELIVGFSEDGKTIFVREVGEEGGEVSIKEAKKMDYEE